ncbi:MAG: queuosine precursor transporter [Bacteroidetes bacterium]|nr:queuosine precursor transporter [Bacteroidota bacterium]
MNLSRKELLFLVLAGFFITNAVTAELIGGKLILVGPFTMSIGIIPWPVVFLTTDLINEYFGRKGVRILSVVTALLIAYVFILLYFGIRVSASPVSPVDDRSFTNVFGQSMWIITGSITAFLTSQFTDVLIFWLIRNRTGKKLLWLRATGSTAISQLIDTFIVLGIAFLLPGKITFEEYISISLSNYTCKLIIAISITPVIYAGHILIERYLGKESLENINSNAKSTAG